MKYGIWNIAQYDTHAAGQLRRNGFSPLTAAVLCSRGYTDPNEARSFLDASAPLNDPLELRDMEQAAQRLRLALSRGEHIAVFGDYDVDGITATCLLTEFLRSQGGKVTCYIPGRIEEGYGLNNGAIRNLWEQGVSLIVTVDCGITANEEAEFCRELGVDLIITDHHECKEQLPCAVAVVDPHRKDRTYPHTNLAGVGVAFKLASAIVGSQEVILERFSDLLCLGTVADVMPLVGENRVFVSRGLKALEEAPRPGLAALMAECNCEGKPITANLLGYTIAPRINAAGRMGQVELATELFLTTDPQEAKHLARSLCQLNRQRQEVEAEIYEQAEQMLEDRAPCAIVLAGEQWHQGVVGIVASRLAEEYGCPTYLICLEGEKGKASSRSYGGFNLFASLEANAHLLESYGGHELAAGFTIGRAFVEPFRQAVMKLAGDFAESGLRKAALEVDCQVEPEMLTEKNVAALEQLEPCGSGCPKPVFSMDGVRVEHVSEVGGGRHLRLRLWKNGSFFHGIFFSVTAERAGIAPGDLIEIAFTPQINEYRGMRSVQLNMVDLRPDSQSRSAYEDGTSLYSRLCQNEPLSEREAAELFPQRKEFSCLWRYLAAQEGPTIREDGVTLSRKLQRFSGQEIPPQRLLVCLDVFRERGLLVLKQTAEGLLSITLSAENKKVDLNESPVLMELMKKKGGA